MASSLLDAFGVSLLMVLSATSSDASPNAKPVKPTPEARARDLANAINHYRADNGLAAIPLSPSLGKVASAHVADLATAKPQAGCNAHSWSARGSWTACCYTPDHAQASCMWKKPAEIAKFSGRGYEIAIGDPGKTGTGFVLDTSKALALWKASPAHDDVIRNRGMWAKASWRSMGVAITDDHAVVWFAEEADASPRALAGTSP